MQGDGDAAGINGSILVRRYQEEERHRFHSDGHDVQDANDGPSEEDSIHVLEARKKCILDATAVGCLILLEGAQLQPTWSSKQIG